MEITKPNKWMGSWLQVRLAEDIEVEQIEAALPNIRDEGVSEDEKCQHTWHFMADGVPCGIWDYRGRRWSAFGPAQVFEQLGLPVTEVLEYVQGYPVFTPKFLLR